MNSERPMRRTYEQSCELLQELGHLEKGSIPPLPHHRPQFDDEEPLGVSFFRTFLGEGDMENLTLPRTVFDKSEIGPVSFRNTDLSESTFCWNDFNEVDFTDADLARSDLRASNFARSVFVRANLRDADLRGSSFEDCNFDEADMLGAKLSRRQGAAMRFSETQRKQIDWQDGDGDEPPGG